ncbi:MAG: Holliday junction resolvase RuvX [Candidatus Saccharimonadales bacterium]
MPSKHMVGQQSDYNVIGVDYGQKRVGVALGHAIARLPRPYKVLRHDDRLLAQLQAIIEGEQVRVVVLGLPVPFGGGASRQTELTLDFGKTLQSTFKLPLYYVNEALTSVEAENELGEKALSKSVDAHAAAAILERYFAGETIDTKGTL